MMRYIKEYKVFENYSDKVSELQDMFNLVIGNAEVFKIPYSYYGNATKERRDFDIYVVSGQNYEPDDHKLLQELYYNHEILNKLLNLEFFHIKITKKYVTIVLYDYVTDPSYNINVKNHLSSIPQSKLNIPQNIKRRLEFTDSHHGNKTISRGIERSDGYSSNLSLYDWIYDPKKEED